MRALILAVAGLLVVAQPVQADVICGCGFTFKQVKTINDRHLTTRHGRTQLRRQETNQARQAVVEHWIIPDTTRIKKNTLRWFKAKYRRVKKDRNKAVKRCLIAYTAAFISEKATGHSIRQAEKVAVAACIAAAISSILEAGEPA